MRRIVTPERRLVAPRLWKPPFRSRQRGFIDISFSSLPAHSSGGGGGGGWSPGPSNIVLNADALGGAIDVFFTGQDARSIPALTQYTAKLYDSSGSTYQGISNTSLVNSTTGGLSQYVRLYGISAGTYKVSVSATNSNGASVETMSTSTVTVVSASDYYMSQGHATSSSVPQQSGWGAYGGSGTNNYADTTRVFPGETNAISISAGGLILPYYQSIWCSAGVNGNLYMTPWTHFVMKVYGTTLSNEIDVSMRWCGQMFGMVSVGGSNTLTDYAQNFVTNGLQNGAASVQAYGTGYAGNAGAGTLSNTANSITDSAGGAHTWNVGDRYIWSVGDQDFSSGSTSGQPIAGGTTSYVTAQLDASTGSQVSTINSYQAGFWNQVKIPLSAMNCFSGAAGSYQQFLDYGAIQELRISNNAGNSTIYVTDVGFTVA